LLRFGAEGFEQFGEDTADVSRTAGLLFACVHLTPIMELPVPSVNRLGQEKSDFS
jgi:hypothetical protein